MKYVSKELSITRFRVLVFPEIPTEVKEILIEDYWQKKFHVGIQAHSCNNVSAEESQASILLLTTRSLYTLRKLYSLLTK
jgi:hypothetical protein